MRMLVTPTGAEATIVECIGSVRDVLAGCIPESLLQQRIDAAPFAFGFELASPRGSASLREAVLVNGRLFATDTEHRSDSYYQTISGETFVPGAMLVGRRGVAPTHRAVLEGGGSLPLTDLYRQLYDQVGGPCIMVGEIHASVLRGTAISHPPTDGRPLFGEGSDPALFPPYSSRERWGWCVGILAHVEDVPTQRLGASSCDLGDFLYHRPGEPEGTLLAHTHVLTLHHRVREAEGVVPGVVDRVLHLYQEGTLVDHAALDVYAIGRLQPWLSMGYGGQQHGVL